MYCGNRHYRNGIIKLSPWLKYFSASVPYPRLLRIVEQPFYNSYLPSSASFLTTPPKAVYVVDWKQPQDNIVLCVTTLKFSVHDDCHQLLTALIPTEPGSGEAAESLHLEGGTKGSQATPWQYQNSSGNGNFSQHSYFQLIEVCIQVEAHCHPSPTQPILNYFFVVFFHRSLGPSFLNCLLCVLGGSYSTPNFEGKRNFIHISLKEKNCFLTRI